VQIADKLICNFVLVMRKITADYIFPIASEPIKNGVITIDDSGIILEISETHPTETEIEYYSGIICPGFINTHCHLELSHMHAQVSENAGMTNFIKEIIGKRFGFSEEKIQQAIAEAENKMIQQGIVAVGDISNNNSTFKQKSKNNLLYHTFIEIFSMDPNKAEAAFENGSKLMEELAIDNLQDRASITPHAPYTMSEKLLTLINNYTSKNKNIITIHNQESESESELFISKSGKMFETFKEMGINTDLIRKTGLNSLLSTLPFLKDAAKILLVHNTYTSREDIQWIKTLDTKTQIYFCTCPNANMYIENRLPDYNYFIGENVPMTIGTDSLASNWSLSILDEIKTIVKQYPEISLQTLLTWATKNGADFLGFDQLGTLEKGKRPGLNLLKDLDGLRITEKTEVLKLA
jgi:cytosine/adenosine deaminase-related metal-dependent hydrolase